MFSKPENGWTVFSVGELQFSLSYLTCIPIDWLDAAIAALTNKADIQVRGCCEPGNMECSVSSDGGMIRYTDEHKRWTEYSAKITKVGFCLALIEDLETNLDDWCQWNPARVQLHGKQWESACKDLRAQILRRIRRLKQLLKAQ